jgi:DNA-binding transcriptional MerR regulator
MNDDERRLSIEDLAGAVGLPVRTVRFYIAEGLIPGPGSRGKLAAYGDEHLLRLRLVRRLADQHVPLTEIRERVNGLSVAEVRALLAEEERRATATLSPRDYIADLLGRARAARRPPVGSAATPAAPLPPSAPPPASPAPQPLMRRALREPSPRLDAPPNALPPQTTAGQAPDFQSPGDFESLTWRRLELAPGVELHVRSDAALTHRALIERVMEAVHKEQNS